MIIFLKVMCKWTFTLTSYRLDRVLLFSYSIQRVSSFVILNLCQGEYSVLFIYHLIFFERTFIRKVYQMLCAIWYDLCNLKNMKNTHGGMSLLVNCRLILLKAILHHECFSRFLNCTNGTKSRNGLL